MNNSIWSKRLKENEKRTCDIRSDYGRDLSRLVHSSAFRRLQSKTQVLGLGESDFYRTRLTHSMEVAQIGHGILLSLNARPNFKNIMNEIDLDVQLLQAICLAHDIGHPPFGHGGEVALNLCMRDFGGFEGNGQTLRILSKLEKYADNHGINPTKRLLLGVLKYPINYSRAVSMATYGAISDTKPKWMFESSKQKPPKCYLDTEIDLVNNFILSDVSSKDRNLFCEFDKSSEKHGVTKYKSFDTSVMDLADEISYSVHDLEDAISLGMISKDKWNSHLNTESGRQILADCQEYFFSETIDSLGEALFSKSSIRKNCIGNIINFFITNTQVDIQCKKFSEPLFKYTVKLPKPVEDFRKLLFNLVKSEVILNENVQQLEFKGQKLIVELFEVLISDPMRLLPETTREKYKIYGDSKEGNRVICDFISGMTDDYATRFYEKLLLPRKGSIFDRL